MYNPKEVVTGRAIETQLGTAISYILKDSDAMGYKKYLAEGEGGWRYVNPAALYPILSLPGYYLGNERGQAKHSRVNHFLLALCDLAGYFPAAQMHDSVEQLLTARLVLIYHIKQIVGVHVSAADCL